MLRPFLLCSSLVQRNLLRSSSRAFSSEVKTRVVRDTSNGLSFKTESREEFERAFPYLAGKQNYHLRMLKEYRLPVHRSGRRDDMANSILYLSGFALLFYTFYLYYVLVKSS